MAIIWTAEEDQILLDGMKAGLSFSEIAKQLNRTKNAAIGRSHRLAPAVHLTKPVRATKVIPTKVAKPSPIVEVIPLKDVVDIDHTFFTAGKTLASDVYNLRSNQCRWPLEAEFCKNDRVEGRSYCGKHCKTAYRSLSS